jgi:hypothetical protein
MSLLAFELELTRKKYRDPKRVSYKQPLNYGKPLNSAYGRQAVIKMNYTAAGKLAKQIMYNIREGAGKDGERPVLFTKKDGQPPNLDKIENEKHIFRVILTPEDGKELDMTDYTRKVMQRAEKVLGTRLEWIATTHYNTDNPHTHIIIRGIDDRNRPLTIDSRFIQEGFRRIAGEEATKELGELTLKEIQERKERPATSLNYTHIDRAISKKCYNTAYITEDKLERKRLDFLCGLGLVKRNEGGYPSYNIPPDLRKKLGLFRHEQKLESITEPLRQKYGITGPTFFYKNKYILSGRVVQKDQVKESEDKEYAVIKTKNNRLYIVKDPQASLLRMGEDVILRYGKIERLKRKL